MFKKEINYEFKDIKIYLVISKVRIKNSYMIKFIISSPEVYHTILFLVEIMCINNKLEIFIEVYYDIIYLRYYTAAIFKTFIISL